MQPPQMLSRPECNVSGTACRAAPLLRTYPPADLSHLCGDKTAVSREFVEFGPDPGPRAFSRLAVPERLPKSPKSAIILPTMVFTAVHLQCCLQCIQHFAIMTFTDSTGLIAARKAAAPNPLKSKLVKGELAHALSIKIISSIEIVGYAASAGYDCVLIDLEHSSFGLDTTNQLSCAALQLG
jgi:hypothetical protein